MYHREVVAKIARHLPHRTRRDVAEVIEVLTEIWSAELAAERDIVLPDIGRLKIEVQQMNAGGVLEKHGQLRRIYGRFRPTPTLKTRIEEALDGKTQET